MRALVLNLAAATDRRAFMGKQLDALCIPWERIEAVTTQTLSPPPGDPIWHRWERPLRVTEMAACSSHMRAWQRVVDLDEACLVLEDDALLDRAVPDLLGALEASRPDIEHVSLETRGRRKVLAPDAYPGLPLRRLYLDRTGAAAYVLWPCGARKLLDRAGRARGLADGIICAAAELRSWQADPALAIQLDRAEAHGIVPPIAPTSQIGAISKPGKGGFVFRLRRLKAQVSQGVRQLRPRTKRCEVPPAGNWVIAPLAPVDTTDAH